MRVRIASIIHPISRDLLVESLAFPLYSTDIQKHRGVALTIQVAAQAAGPVLSGALRDATGSYAASLWTFGALALAGTLAALFSKHPEAGSARI